MLTVGGTGFTTGGAVFTVGGAEFTVEEPFFWGVFIFSECEYLFERKKRGLKSVSQCPFKEMKKLKIGF